MNLLGSLTQKASSTPTAIKGQENVDFLGVDGNIFGFLQGRRRIQRRQTSGGERANCARGISHDRRTSLRNRHASD